jgi:hypothetical protein
MMPRKEWTKTCHNARLDIGLLQAFYVSHTFPRHSHDYYVICLIRRGLQSFTHEGKKHYTPPGGVILINPGAVHTGEAADESGGSSGRARWALPLLSPNLGKEYSESTRLGW